MATFIYVATNRVTNKSYVGQTRVSVSRRWAAHVKAATNPTTRHCRLISRAIRKYGVSSFDLRAVRLDDEMTDDGLNELETRLIAHLGTLAPNGYNLHAGGGQGRVSAETRALISAAMKGRKLPDSVKAKIRAANLGQKRAPYSAETLERLSVQRRGRKRRPHSAETKAKMHAAAVGRSMSDEARAKIDASNRVRTVSQETRELMRLSRLGRPRGMTCAEWANVREGGQA